jgi:hypothetical protein
MAVIAIIAPLLALTRDPFAFGLIVFAGLIAVFVTISVRRRRYELIAWLIITYPALPLLTLYLQWELGRMNLAPRSSRLFDGLIGLSDTGGYLCLIAYVACIALVASRRLCNAPSLKRAAKQLVFIMPPTWACLFAFAIWDPFGMLAYFFH